MQKIITDNSEEIIRITWDRTRFAIVTEWRGRLEGGLVVTVLNPREMDDIFEFVKEVKSGS